MPEVGRYGERKKGRAKGMLGRHKPAKNGTSVQPCPATHTTTPNTWDDI